MALAHGVPVLQPERLRDEAFLRAVGDLRPDLGVVAAYGGSFQTRCSPIPRLGMINVHGSILPAWRGAAPVHRAIIAGDAETGVTIMRVVKELDAGAMFATVPRTIGPNETSVEVERDLAELGAGLLADTVEALADGRAVETPQPHRGRDVRGQADEGRERRGVDGTGGADSQPGPRPAALAARRGASCGFFACSSTGPS